jgi:hypothetical protein
MKSGSLVAIKCTISRGGFSSERIFQITLTSGVDHVGAAPVEYFLGLDLQRLAPSDPARGADIEGFVTGRLSENEDGNCLVSVPSGDVLSVPESDIQTHPTGNTSHVPV